MEMKLRSSIKPEFARNMLFRGTLLAGIGIALLVFGGAFIPASYLSQWGLILFLVAGGLVAWGLIPYRRLMQLEVKPNELIIDQKSIEVTFKRKPTLVIPFSAIQEMRYLENSKIYGIQIWLKKDAAEKVVIQDSQFDPKSSRKYGCDLFLPYFSKNSFNELNSKNDLSL